MKSNMDVSTVVIEMKDIVKKFGNFTRFYFIRHIISYP